MHLGGMQALFFPGRVELLGSSADVLVPSVASVGTVLDTDPVPVVCSPKHTTPTRRAAWRRTGTSSPAVGLAPALSLAWPLWKRCWGRKWLNR